MPHLRSVRLSPTGQEERQGFPFDVPVIRHLEPLAISPTITFLVGENGSGKSTLLEGIAAAVGLPAIASESVDRDGTLESQRALGKALHLTWNRKVSRGFFLRAEDFFGFTKTLSRMRAEFLTDLGTIAADYAGRSEYAKRLAMGPTYASLADMERRYGANLDANSHGQSFLKLFQTRFVPGGLYLLDEPEAPLSPQSQLGLMSMIGDMLRQHAQFIVATHSPILLGFPDATIYSCDQAPVRETAYEELEHVVITRDFLNARERFLKHL